MFSRFLEPYLASAFNAGRTIGISAADHRGAYRGDQGESGRHGHAYGSVGTTRFVGTRGRIRVEVAAAGRPARRGCIWSSSEGLEIRTLLATIPAATADGGAAEPLEHDGQRRRRERQREQLGGGGRPARSVEAGGGLDRQRSDDVRGHGQRDRGRSWRRRIRSTAARAGSPLLGEPTNGERHPGRRPSCSTRRRPARRSPTPYVTSPSLGFDDSGNFYILSEYSSAATAAGSTSGALVLQKYNFTGSTPTADTVHHQRADPDSLRRLASASAASTT